MNNENPQNTNIVMTADPLTIAPDLTAYDALKKMYHAHYHSMPVVDAEDHFVGLFRRNKATVSLPCRRTSLTPQRD